MKKKVAEIESTISNKDEAAKALALVAEVINMFTDKMIEVSERQVKLEERVEEVLKQYMISNKNGTIIEKLLLAIVKKNTPRTRNKKICRNVSYIMVRCYFSLSEKCIN